MGRPVLAALLAVALSPGCEEADVDDLDGESEFVDLYLDDGIEVCGGQLASYDRFIEDVFRAWTGDAPGDLRVAVHAVAESDCPGGLGCATNGNAWLTHDRGQYHEIVHVMQRHVDGRSVVALEEGTAEGFGPGGPLAHPPSGLATLTPDFLYADRLTATEYGAAAVFTRFLVDTFGTDTYRSFFRAMHLVDASTPSAFDEQFEIAFGQPLADIWPEFVSEPRCAYDTWYCDAATPVSMPFEIRDFRCEDIDVLGFDASALDLAENQFSMTKIVVVDNEVPRTVEVEVEFADVDIAVCGDCSQQQPVLSLSSFEGIPGEPPSIPIDIVNGSYVFIIRARPGGVPRVSVRDAP